jgi:hypothetical protein
MKTQIDGVKEDDQATLIIKMMADINCLGNLDEAQNKKIVELEEKMKSNVDAESVVHTIQTHHLSIKTDATIFINY